VCALPSKKSIRKEAGGRRMRQAYNERGRIENGEGKKHGGIERLRSKADWCCPGGSMITTIELTREAAEAGASHAIVICPGK